MENVETVLKTLGNILGGASRGPSGDSGAELTGKEKKKTLLRIVVDRF